MLSEARKRANQKYNEKAYDQIKIMVKKGERDIIKQFAESRGKSLNGYINELILADMEQAGVKLRQEPAQEQTEE